MKTPTRYYDRLTAAERAALTIEALARQDLVEADRLSESCPIFSYRGIDLNYTLRLSELHRLALLYANEVLELSGRQIAAMYVQHHWQDSDRERSEQMADLVLSLVSRIEAWHLGWQRFSADVGVDPNIALKAFGIKEQLGNATGLFRDAITADPEEIDRVYTDLTDCWATVIDRFSK